MSLSFSLLLLHFSFFVFSLCYWNISLSLIFFSSFFSVAFIFSFQSFFLSFCYVLLLQCSLSLSLCLLLSFSSLFNSIYVTLPFLAFTSSTFTKIYFPCTHHLQWFGWSLLPPPFLIVWKGLRARRQSKNARPQKIARACPQSSISDMQSIVRPRNLNKCQWLFFPRTKLLEKWLRWKQSDVNIVSNIFKHKGRSS